MVWHWEICLSVRLIVSSYKPEAALLGSAEPFPPPLLAGAAGLAGITVLAFSNMAITWSLEAGWREMRTDTLIVADKTDESLVTDKMHNVIFYPQHNMSVQYFEFPSSLGHFVVTQVHHEGGQGVLSFLPHISISVLQAGIKLRDTQHQIPRYCPQGGQLLC